MEQHKLPVPPLDDIEDLTDGTNPVCYNDFIRVTLIFWKVFLVNDMVVKFYSKRTGGERSFLAYANAI